MARTQRTPRFPKGTRVSKYFNGYAQAFGGTVDGYAPATNFYHISYDDGDSEEMTEDDVEVHFHYLPQIQAAGQPIPPVPTKKQQAAISRAVAARPRRMHSPPPPEALSPPRNGEEEVVEEEEEEEEEGGFAMVLSLNDNAPPTVRDNHLDLSPLHVDIPKETNQAVEPMVDEEEDEEEEEEEEEMEVEEEGPEGEYAATVGPDDINQLIGKPVVRQFPKTDGTGTEPIRGTVSIFFPATKMFRVLFANSACEDMSYQEVIDSIPLYSSGIPIAKKRKASVDSDRSEKVRATPTASPKRPKTLVPVEKSAFPNGETTPNEAKPAASSKPATASSPRPPVRDEPIEFTADTGLDVLRKVLFVLVSTPSITHESKAKQLKVLGATDIEPKKALQRFIKADGVSLLSELLKLWSTSNEAESGVLVTLKVLAVLPGITREVLQTSKIGVRIGFLDKKCTFENAGISELARWVKEKWRAQIDAEKASSKTESSPRDASPRPEAVKYQSSSQEKAADRRASKSNGTIHTVFEEPLKEQRAEPSAIKHKQVGETNGSGPAKASKRAATTNEKSTRDGDSSDTRSARPKDPLSSRQSKSAGHLKALLSGGSLRGKDSLSKAASTVVKKRLGTPANWRARRSTVVLENVSKRVNEQASEREQQERKRRQEEQALARRRINFGDQDVLLFDKEVEPTKLFTWFSSNARFLSRRATARPDQPLDYKPKSILKWRSAYPDVVMDENPIAAVAPSDSVASTATKAPSTGGENVPSRPSLPSAADGASMQTTGDEDSAIRQQTAQLTIHPPARARPISEAMSPTDGRRKTDEPRRCRSPPPPPALVEDDRASVEEGEVSSDVEMMETPVQQAPERGNVDVDDEMGVASDTSPNSPVISITIDTDALAAAAAAGAKHAAEMEVSSVTVEADDMELPIRVGTALMSQGEASAAAFADEQARPPPPLST